MSLGKTIYFLKGKVSHSLPLFHFPSFLLRCPSLFLPHIHLFLSYQFMVMGSTPWQIRHNRNNEISLYSLSFSLYFFFMGATKRLLEKIKIMRKIRWNNMKISGDMIGKYGNRMGNTQRFTKFFLGLLFSRSGVKQKETWIFQGQYKKKKDLM